MGLEGVFLYLVLRLWSLVDLGAMLRPVMEIRQGDSLSLLPVLVGGGCVNYTSEESKREKNCRGIWGWER